jgi:hypothetical protein
VFWERWLNAWRAWAWKYRERPQIEGEIAFFQQWVTSQMLANVTRAWEFDTFPHGLPFQDLCWTVFVDGCAASAMASTIWDFRAMPLSKRVVEGIRRGAREGVFAQKDGCRFEEFKRRPASVCETLREVMDLGMLPRELLAVLEGIELIGVSWTGRGRVVPWAGMTSIDGSAVFISRTGRSKAAQIDTAIHELGHAVRRKLLREAGVGLDELAGMLSAREWEDRAPNSHALLGGGQSVDARRGRKMGLPSPFSVSSDTMRRVVWEWSDGSAYRDPDERTDVCSCSGWMIA